MKNTKDKKETKVENNIEATEENETNVKAEVIEKEFVPQRIGEEDNRLADEAWVSYEYLSNEANNLKTELAKCLNINISLDEFLDFLKSNPENWIYTKFVAINKIAFPGLSTEKIIELKLLDIKGVEDVLAAQSKFTIALNRVKKSNFVYPFRNLYDTKENMFTVPMEVTFKAEDNFSRRTQSEKQNIILDKFNKLCEVLNELNELDIVRTKNGPDEISILTDYIKVSKIISFPTFVVDSYLFNKHRTRIYREKGLIQNNKTFNEFFA